MRVFVINPGSTSTKLALYEGEHQLISREYRHDKTHMAQFSSVVDQKNFRMSAIRETLDEAGIDTASIDGVAGRGGLLHPLEGGVYQVNEAMLSDLSEARYGEHPCNLGAILANDLALEWSVSAFIVDPVVTDEMMDIARLTGLPCIRRRSLFHALNQRGAARTVAARLGKTYDKLNCIVCHMGGGTSIGAHCQGKVVDVINALDGEGPFTPERTGGMPLLPLLDMIDRGDISIERLKEIIQREGGVFAHLGTNDMMDIENRVKAGEPEASEIFGAMAYGIARHASSLVPAFAAAGAPQPIDAVILTGGLARCTPLVERIADLMQAIAPVEAVTGDEEMAALAAGARRVLLKEEEAKTYTPAS